MEIVLKDKRTPIAPDIVAGDLLYVDSAWFQVVRVDGTSPTHKLISLSAANRYSDRGFVTPISHEQLKSLYGIRTIDRHVRLGEYKLTLEIKC